MANQVSQVNFGFGSPGMDYGAEISEIERRRALAKALQQQSMEPAGQGLAPGVRMSPFQGMAKLGEALAGNLEDKRASDQQRELASKSQQDYRQMVAQGLRQLQGTPATGIAEDASGNVTPPQPAGAPDPMAALSTFGSHPMGQALMPLATQQLQRQQMVAALRGGASGSPQTNAAPGGSGSPAAPGAPQGASPGGPAGGLPMEFWLQVDPTGKAYAEQVAKDTTKATEGYNLAPSHTRYGPGGQPIVTAPAADKPPEQTPVTPITVIDEQGRAVVKDARTGRVLGRSPQDPKLAGAFNQDTAALQSTQANMDRLAGAANQLLQHQGLSGITGVRGKIPNIPGSAAADASALLNTLKSQVAFGVLQDMRNNSKTGGALGNVSDAEGRRLEANLAALETSQSEAQMKRSLQAIIDYTSGANDRMRDAFNLKHGGQGGLPTTPDATPQRRATDKKSLTPAEQQELNELRKRFGR